MNNQEVVKSLKNIRDLYPWGEDSYKTLDYAIRAVVELPKRRKEAKRWRAKALEQEPKTGHWEWVQYDYNPILGNWHCSECRCIVVECVGKKEKGGIPFYKYCPQCGCRMVEPQESEDI